LFDRLGPELDMEGVLGDLPGDARHFCRSPHKNIFVALKEVDELIFLFEAQAGPDLDGLGWVLRINLDGLGVLDSIEDAGRGGHGRIRRRGWCVLSQLSDSDHGHASSMVLCS
jgi:hypothetical protein